MFLWRSWRHLGARCRGPRRFATLAEDVATYANMKPTPVNLHSWLAELIEPVQIAKFLSNEMPVRYAERIRSIESLPDWEGITELVEAHRIQLAAFQRFLELSRNQDFSVQTCKPVIKAVQAEDKMTKNHLMLAARSLRSHRGSDSFEDPFTVELNKFLNDFLLSRLGCNMLMGQYLACASSTSPQPHGIVSPQCDAFEICGKAADEVMRRCEISQGRSPKICVEAFTMTGRTVTQGEVPRFSYIPGILMHIVRELLKNSCQATLELAKSEAELSNLPIHVVVCADKRHVVIRITDRARGIPRHASSKIWSYLYSGSPTAMAGLSFGLGIGLPLSRLHAKYLGGSLDLVSLPGFGVDAYLSLPRVETDLVENVPDLDDDPAQEINLLTL